MKIRLVAISEEDFLSAPQTATAAADNLSAVEPIVMARLSLRDWPSYYNICVPYEQIQGAQIGDEFTLHLERVGK